MILRFRAITMLLFIVTLFSKNYAAQPPAKDIINPEKLYLKQVLTKMRDLAVVYDQEQEESSSIQHLPAVNYVIVLFDNIVNDFNNGALATNQEIKYKFINMCNYLKSIEDLEPRHLRILKKQIQKFDDYIKKFCLRRKKYLTQQDLDLFNRITQFNHCMTEGLLNNEYLDIDGYDQCFDWFVHRPCEFVKEHKTLVALTFLSIGVAVGYYYLLRPWLNERDLANQNQQLNVRQIPSLVQAGNTCPYYALYNYTCMRDANGDINQMQQLMNDRERFNQFFNNCTQYLATQGAIDAESIERLIDNGIVPGNNTELVIVPNADALNNVNGLDNYRFIQEAGQITHARQNFNNNQRQYFIINTTNLAGQENNTAALGGHWVTIGVVPFPQENEPVALVTDSFGLAGFNRNITDAPYINRIHDILTQPLELN